MKKILIVIGDMKIGGAQKSLLSFLKCLSASDEMAQYQVDLMVVDPAGEFYNQIPAQIRLLPAPKPLRWLGSALSFKLLTQQFSLQCLKKELGWLVRKRLGKFPEAWNTQQKLWHCWKEIIPQLSGHYDTAISYIDGFPNYYVTEKVNADKKVLWVHSEYQKMQYDPAYDRPFYQKADSIITISEQCRQCILQEFPQCEVSVLENITVARDVREKSMAGDCPEFSGFDGLKLLTVARLNPYKGVDIAIDGAAELKKQGVPFLWLVVGDGPERERLQAQIHRLALDEQFCLLGSRGNPYPYMRACDILVQPSRVEGKSIVLDEAKILGKLIVSTNYTTVNDSLQHMQTGVITEIDPQSLAQGILQLHRDPSLQRQIKENVRQLPQEDGALLRRYIETMF